MAFVISSFMPKSTMVQIFPSNAKPCTLQNKNVSFIRCAAKRPSGVNPGSPPQINQVLRVAGRSLRADQVIGLRSLNSGEDGKATAGNTVVDDVSNTTKTADATD